MNRFRAQFSEHLPAIAAATRTTIIFISMLSIPLAAADTLGLSRAQSGSWMLAILTVPGILGIVLARRYRQPLLFTGNIFMVIFISRLGTRFGYSELIGASILAGALVLLTGLLGMTERLARWIPVPVVFALLAGAVLSFVVGIFGELENAPLLAGGTFAIFLLSHRLLGRRVPAVFPALVGGLAIAALTGQLGPIRTSMTLETPVITAPAFSLDAAIAAVPVFFVLIALQSNVPSVRYLQSQDYRPADLVISLVSGAGTILGSLLGPTGISLSLLTTSLVASPDAGATRLRHRAVYLAGGGMVLLGLVAGGVAALANVVPVTLLMTLAGLALVDVLGSALKRVTEGPLWLGPLFTFAVALSNISFLGLSDTFWALVIGTGVSWLLEREGLVRLRERATAQA